MESPQMNYQNKRGPSWVAIILFVAALGGLAYWVIPSGKSNDKNKTSDSGQVQSGDSTSGEMASLNIPYDADALNVGLCTWPGYGTAVLFNNGLLDNEGSRFRKDYDLKVNLNVLDDPLTNRPAFMNGEIDLIWTTVDAFASEAAGLNASPAYAKICFATDCSAGGDVFVSKGNIKSVSDLRGKTIAYATLTPSHSFLMYVLSTAGMTLDDVNVLETGTPTQAADLFKDGKADCAVVWAPDDQECLKKVEGSRVFTSTKTASNLIYNVFLVRRDYLANHKDRLVKFFEGWMVANAELKAGGESAKERVAQALVDNMGWNNVEDAKAAMDRVKFLTMGDNLNLFGLNEEYKGAVANDIYSKFGSMYLSAGKIEKAPPSWSGVFDKSIVVAVSKDLKGSIHKAEGRKEFTPVTNEVANEPSLSRKSISVNFSTGSAVLDDEAKNKIKAQFGDAIQTYRDARIRVVGNTDNTGNPAANKELSLRRAKAVKAYLVSEYDSDPDRFIIIGNGPKDAIADGVEGESEKYRRTDFELVQE